MTIVVANTALTNTWDYWRTRTNELAHAMTNYAVTTNSNTATGNAAISGTFTANVLIANVISIGGTNSISVNVVTSNTATITSLTTTSTIATTANLTTINANVINSNTANVTSITGNSIVYTTANLTTINANVINSNTANVKTITSNSISANIVTVNNYIYIGNSTANITLSGANSLQSNGSYFLNGNGSYVIPSYTPTTPGSNTQIIVNDSGTSNAYSDLTFNKSTKTLYVANAISLGNTNDGYISGITAGTSLVNLDSFSISSYRAAEYLISIKNTAANGYQLSKILAVHDDGVSYITEYGTLTTNGTLASFTSNIASSNFVLEITPSVANTSIKVKRTVIAV